MLLPKALQAHIRSLAVVLIVVIMWLPVCVGVLVKVCVCSHLSSIFQHLRRHADTVGRCELCLLSPLL